MLTFDTDTDPFVERHISECRKFFPNLIWDFVTDGNPEVFYRGKFPVYLGIPLQIDVSLMQGTWVANLVLPFTSEYTCAIAVPNAAYADNLSAALEKLSCHWKWLNTCMTAGADKHLFLFPAPLPNKKVIPCVWSSRNQMHSSLAE